MKIQRAARSQLITRTHGVPERGGGDAAGEMTSSQQSCIAQHPAAYEPDRMLNAVMDLFLYDSTIRIHQCARA